jgi:hypothetical protein
MNNLQGGITSSQLSPQAFKNSNQSGNVQSVSGSSQLQDSAVSSSSLNYVLTDTKLTVSESSSTLKVLGTSTGTATTTTTTVVEKSNTGLYFSLTLLVVSVILAVYFIQKYRKTPAEQESDSE